MSISFFIIIFLIVSLLLNPSLCIIAAKEGLLLWFNNIIPSLLPFIIGSNMLILSGNLIIFNSISNTIMSFLFNLPGNCAFPWITGLLSGYPMGARTIATLQNDKQITPNQSQKLMSFCNNPGPFFIIGTIGIGIFSNQHIGYFLLLIQFISSLLIGMFFPYDKTKDKHFRYTKTDNKNKESPSIGKVLDSSIKLSMEVITQIGGYIILFSVIGAILKPIISFLTNNLSPLITPLFLGFIELTTGIFHISPLHISLVFKLSIISFFLSWGGFCVHAQSLGFFSKLELNTSVYLLSKFINAITSFFITLVFFPIFFTNGNSKGNFLIIVAIVITVILYTLISKRKSNKIY